MDAHVETHAARQRANEVDAASCWKDIADEIRCGDVATGIARLCHRLDASRARVAPSAWRRFVAAPDLDPVRDVLDEDPFTRRARAKPRGFAGDAVMLDLVYGLTTLEGTTELGRRIHAYVIASDACDAVRDRLRLVTAAVDDAGARRAGARVLALACGHLREAQRSVAVAAGRIARYDALDQDADALAVVRAEQAGITTVHARVDAVMAGAVPLGRYDLVYAAGLYDYLPAGAARSLTRAAFDLLAPGGRLLVGNFAEGARDAAFLEAITSWWLVYRDEAALASLADALPPGEVADVSVFGDARGQLLYLDVRRC